MASKRRFSFWWRLFVPMVTTSWLLVATLMAYNYHREKNYREQYIRQQLDLFGARVIQANADRLDLAEYMNFLGALLKDSRYQGLRISVFLRDDIENDLPPSFYIGTPIDKQRVANQNDFEDTHEAFEGTGLSASGRNYYYKAVKSNDGTVQVVTALPYSASLDESLRAGDVTFWIILVILIVIATLIAYFITNTITRNINMLRDFATNANNDHVRFDETQFPHDELGDISREIVRLYRERSSAVEKGQKEHAIALHAIEEKSRIKRQMTNNINHELKTPVGVIKGYLDTVLTSDDMDEATRNYFLKRAQDNVNRLCNLLNDVSTMTRLEEGSGNIPVSQLNFHDLVFAIDNDFSTAGMTGGMTFEYDLPLDCEVMGNSNLLTSAISNLIKNAVIHSHGTAMGIRVVAQSDRYYTFSFWDNGTGVAQTHIPHLFDRFYRVDSGRSRKTGGTGLGLPIVKNIIESLGGSISVSNRSGGGLQFMFTLRKV